MVLISNADVFATRRMLDRYVGRTLASSALACLRARIQRRANHGSRYVSFQTVQMSRLAPRQRAFRITFYPPYSTTLWEKDAVFLARGRTLAVISASSPLSAQDRSAKLEYFRRIARRILVGRWSGLGGPGDATPSPPRTAGGRTSLGRRLRARRGLCRRFMIRRVAAPVLQLVFKGSHNSYESARGADMASQMDDWGVWVFELDGGVRDGAAGSYFAIGHDGIGMAADDDGCVLGSDVDAYLDQFTRARSFAFRPVFIIVDHKPAVDIMPTTDAQACGVLMSAARRRGLLAVDDLSQVTPVQLAGCFHFGLPSGPVQAAIGEYATGPYGSGGPEDVAIAIGSGEHAPRINEIRADWTFDFGVPPNPICVRAGAQPPHHGTFLHPFSEVAAARVRALGATGWLSADSTRRGDGFTIATIDANGAILRTEPVP